jgi:hypothetical protein
MEVFHLCNQAMFRTKRITKKESNMLIEKIWQFYNKP